MRYIALLCTILFLIVGVKLCITGDHDYEEAQVLTQPQHTDYDTFASDRPLSGWFVIDGCSIDQTEGAFRSQQVNAAQAARPTNNDRDYLRKAQAIYVPVHSPAHLDMPAEIILLSRDPDLVGAVKNLGELPDTAAHAVAPRIVKGMVRAPAELPENVRRVLGSSIYSQSIIIDEYAAPSIQRALQTMFIGSAMILMTATFWLLLWRRDRKSTEFPEDFMRHEVYLEDDMAE